MGGDARNFTPVIDDFLDKLYSPRSRPAIHRLFVLVLCVTSSYSLGKMLALLLGPGSAPRPRAVPYHFSLPRIASQAQQIISRNLFYGEQPGKAGAVSLRQANGPCLTATRRTSSSITLINTVTLQNAKKSVAMVKVPSQPKLFGLRQGDQIPAIGVVGLIEGLRMIFLNSRTGQCEFVAGKKEPDIAPPGFSVLSKKEGGEIF